MHGLYGIGLISVLAPALSLIELQVPRDTRAMYLTTVFMSLSTFLYIWLNLAGFDPAHTKGLTQRVFSSINSLWPAVTAMILLREPQFEVCCLTHHWSQRLAVAMISSQHIYEVRPRKDHHGVDLISDGCRSVGSGMTDRTLPAMQSATPASTAAHMVRNSRLR